MSRTRRLSQVAQEAQRLADLGASAQEIADGVGVDKSTVTRWLQAGKITRSNDKATVFAPVTPRQSPAEWAKAMRSEFMLSASDEQLVTLGEQALSLTRDVTVSAQVQLSAASRFQSIVKQLAISTRAGIVAPKPDDQPDADAKPDEPKKNPPVRRPKTDPRTLYMVPKAVSE